MKIWDVRTSEYCTEFNALGQAGSNNCLDNLIYSEDGDSLLLGIEAPKGCIYEVKQYFLTTKPAQLIFQKKAVEEIYTRALANDTHGGCAIVTKRAIDFIMAEDKYASCIED